MKILNYSVTPKKLLIIIAIGFIAILLLGFATLEVTSKPIFCNSCHYMSEYYKQWKISSHNKVACLECHTKPGINNYVKRKFEAMHEVVSMATGKYPMRPRAEVEDASCLRSGCHQTQLIKSNVQFKGVAFDHATHLNEVRRGRKLRCTSCHAQMVMGSHMAVAKETCFLCHFKKMQQTPEAQTSAFCIKCHTMPDTAVTIRGTQATFTHKDYLKEGVQCKFCHTNIIRGDGNVSEVMCSQCHNKPEHIAKINDLEFIHETHITLHKIECSLCHTEIEHSVTPKKHSSAKSSNPASCTQCHGSRHSAAEQLYQGVGAKGVASVQSSMYQAHLACIACHTIQEKDTALFSFEKHFPRADKSGCITCHGSDGAEYLVDWQKQIQSALSAASASLIKAQNMSKLAKNPEAQQIIADARYNIHFVKVGRGIHNLEYSLSILEQTKEQLEKACASGSK